MGINNAMNIIGQFWVWLILCSMSWKLQYQDVLLGVGVPLMKHLAKCVGSQEQASLLQVLQEESKSGLKSEQLEPTVKEASYAVTTRAQARRQKPESGSADVLSCVSSPGGFEPITDNTYVNMHDETPCVSGAQSRRPSSGVTSSRLNIACLTTG